MFSLFLDCIDVSIYLYCTQSEFLCDFQYDFSHQNKYRLNRLKQPQYDTHIISTRDTIFRYFD